MKLKIYKQNYQIIIEYDGSKFVGWQIQKNGRSIQGEIQKVIKQVFGSGLPVVLHVAILKSVSPTRELGFTGKSLARRATSEYWEYDFRTENPKGKSFDPQPGSSYLYETRVNDQQYTIYIPHDVMNDETPPWRIMVVLEIPEQ